MRGASRSRAPRSEQASRRRLSCGPQDEGRFALAGAAVGAGLAAIYSSSLWILIAAALIGAWLGYKGERLGRFYVERALARSRSR